MDRTISSCLSADDDALHNSPPIDEVSSLEQVDIDTEHEETQSDGLLSHESADDLYLRDSVAEGEDDLPASERQSRMWRVDHSFGNYKYKWDELVSKTGAPDFDGSEAIAILQRPFTIDYGSRKAGARPASDKDTYYPVFHLDFISVVGTPLQSITRRSERFFDNVTISFQHWQAPYSVKHGPDVPFDLTNRTFRLATGATRELWFIVMHPVGPTAPKCTRQNASKNGSALVKHHAEALASYIKSVFLTGELLGEGIEPAWLLGGQPSQTITYNKWTAFQEIFMEGWVDFVEQYSHEPFWMDNQPAFHAYDYGANIEIEVTDGVQTLEREVRLRPDEEDDNDDDDDDDDADDSHDDDVDDRESEAAEDDMDTEQRLQNDRSEASTFLVQELHGQSPFGEPEDQPIPPSAEGPVSQEGIHEALYSPGLRELRAELEQKYNLHHLASVSYALAVNLHCTAGTSSSGQSSEQAVCLLADRNCLAREYATYRDYTFYPLGFHPAYGNFSSPEPPAFLKNGLLAIMKDNMSFENEGADVLSFDHFQAYSNIKRSLRHRASDLLASQGSATAALTIPEPDVKVAARVKAKRQRLLNRLRGRLTPGDPDASTPFARERQRIEAAVREEEFSFRFEQVITINVRRLVQRRRNFTTVLRPIFQLMRFFLKEKQSYSWILRRFPSEVFPGILIAFARIFERAIGEIERRFTAGGSRGLGLALSEAVAALDRLGNFCFTGDPRVLPTRVFRPLRTMDSLRNAGWPYIDPTMLDFRAADGIINIGRWPVLVDDRPLLMHVASLAYHYGPTIAANRHSQLWFSELGGQSIQGISSAGRFLEKAFADLWIPQTRTFVGQQLHRRLNQGLRSGRGEPAHQAGAELRAWEECEEPFRWRKLEGLPEELIIGDRNIANLREIPTRSRYDYVEDMFDALTSTDVSKAAGFAPRHATWFSVIRAAIEHTNPQTVTKAQWIDGLAAAMHSCGIEWVPGRHRQKLTHRRIVRLVGSVMATDVLAARPGSLKRLALEAEAQQQTLDEGSHKRARRRRIDFGCSIPFVDIPPLVRDGFKRLDGLFGKAKDDHKVLEHYQQARNCLQRNLGQPLCDLMLMLVLTVSASSVTPQVAPKERWFSGAPKGKQKESPLLAANMVTRMLWFLQPNDFPWGSVDDGSVLRISEMTKKIEHKGVSNRVLRELGWIQVDKQRDSPRNSESSLSPRDELESLYRDLLYLRKDPEGFIAYVFKSEDKIWVERCESIIR